MEAVIIKKGSQVDVYALSIRQGEIIYQVDFFNTLDKDTQNKIVARIDFLSDNRPPIKNENVSKKLDDNLFELKAKKARLLYFYYVGDRVVITHGFPKKGQKTPKKEIKRAKALRNQFLSS